MHQCPSCESFDVKEEITVSEFDYGLENPVTLYASIPVMTCNICKESWTDYRGEQIKDTMVTTLFPRKTQGETT